MVIGAGAAGMMAAGRAVELGASVLLLEKMERPGKKILISGKTRCNLTNTKDLKEFVQMYGHNGKFLYSAFHRFFRDELIALLARYDVDVLERLGQADKGVRGPLEVSGVYGLGPGGPLAHGESCHWQTKLACNAAPGPVRLRPVSRGRGVGQ